jgi:predicted LPLAT superfamily acyltransferase
MIDLDPNSVSAAFQVKSCIERGEFVALLADRAAPGRTVRTGDATLLGDPARFPLGPFLLACVLECPVLFALCVCTGPSRYETLLRPIGEPMHVPRAEREKRASELLARYVALLEATCTRLPFQWFNFYDFWDDDAAERSA